MVAALVVQEEVSPSASAAPWRKKGIRTHTSAVKLSEVPAKLKYHIYAWKSGGSYLVPRSSDKSKIGNNKGFALGSGRDGGNCSNLEFLTYILEYKQGLAQIEVSQNRWKRCGGGWVPYTWGGSLLSGLMDANSESNWDSSWHLRKKLTNFQHGSSFIDQVRQWYFFLVLFSRRPPDNINTTANLVAD